VWLGCRWAGEVARYIRLVPAILRGEGDGDGDGVGDAGLLFARSRTD